MACGRTATANRKASCSLCAHYSFFLTNHSSLRISPQMKHSITSSILLCLILLLLTPASATARDRDRKRPKDPIA